MDFFHLSSALMVLCAIMAYLNFRFLKLPTTIGLMVISLIFSLCLIVAGKFFPGITLFAEKHLNNINFSSLLLEGMLSFMLFAGAIHIKYNDLKSEKLSILLFSTFSVVISTTIIGFSAFYILPLFGLKIPLMYCLLFGSLISPTDPISVLSILKKAGVSKSLETKIAGESLFNDGVAVVVFLTILNLAGSSQSFSFINAVMLFGKEAIGGIVLGGAVGWLSFKLIKSIDHYQTEALITIATVMGGYTLAHYSHVSGPLAMVVAGLITGNQGRKLGMSELTSDYIDKFWEIIDEILNALLFVLIGLELLLISFEIKDLVIGILFIVLVLTARYISIYLPSLLIRLKEPIDKNTIKILTWGGLRGGISIALALSVPPAFGKDIWLTLTYIIVSFSILIQGLTISKIANRT